MKQMRLPMVAPVRPRIVSTNERGKNKKINKKNILSCISQESKILNICLSSTKMNVKSYNKPRVNVKNFLILR